MKLKSFNDFNESFIEPNNLNIGNETNKTEEDLKKALSEVSNHIWRLKKRMVDDSGEPKDETKRLFRHVQAALDDLNNAGIEIKEFNGQIIPENGVLSLRVLAYQPTNGIIQDQVIETVKPGIFYYGETIQHAEVIIGIPQDQGV